MVTEKLIEWFMWFVAAVVDSLPGLPSSVENAVAAFPGQIQVLVDAALMFSPIFPFDFVEGALRVYVGGFGIAVLISLFQKGLSLFTGGGGK